LLSLVFVPKQPKIIEGEKSKTLATSSTARKSRDFKHKGTKIKQAARGNIRSNVHEKEIGGYVSSRGGKPQKE